MTIMSKVNEKRNCKIQEAANQQKWEEVSYLLDQPLENSLRRDRRNKTFSMNISVSTEGQHTEFSDCIAAPTSDPLEAWIAKEESTQLIEALLTLTKVEQEIVVGRYLEDKSFAQLARETGLSDKTVKKRLHAATQCLKNTLDN